MIRNLNSEFNAVQL
jgi:hypothetical protein